MTIYLIRHRQSGEWWSNEGGWDEDLGYALVFTEEECERTVMPFGGEWVGFREIGSS